MMTYTYDQRTEAVARAIAKAQGWDLGDDAYSVIQTPGPRALEFWNMAVAAIQASESTDPGMAEARDILADRYPHLEWAVRGGTIKGSIPAGGFIDVYCQYSYWHRLYQGSVKLASYQIADGRGVTPLEAVEAAMIDLRAHLNSTIRRFQPPRPQEPWEDQSDRWQPVPVQGEPVSQTIINDRGQR
jgi:hypothetical protein